MVAAASFDYGERAFVVFPPEQLTLDSYRHIPRTQLNAVRVSVMVGLCAALLASLIGVPAALGIVRGTMRGKTLILAMFRAPLQIPGVVTGLAFLKGYYLIGDLTGLYATGSFLGLVVAHTFVATPYVIGTLVPLLQRFNARLEEAALSLGASRWSTFRRVTLPLIMPGIFGGALYAFIVSFGDVPIAIFISSPQYTTFPVEVFLTLEQEFEPTLLATSTIVIVLSLAVVIMIQRLVGLAVFIKTS
jgi:putative spermidine/putrescine transport system permease protein